MDVWMVVNVGLSLLLVGCQHFRPSSAHPHPVSADIDFPAPDIDNDRYVAGRRPRIDTRVSWEEASVAPPSSAISDIDRKSRIDEDRYIDQDDTRHRFDARRRRYIDVKDLSEEPSPSRSDIDSAPNSDSDRYIDTKARRINGRDRYMYRRKEQLPSTTLPDIDSTDRAIDRLNRYIDNMDPPASSLSSRSDIDTNVRTRVNRYIDKRDFPAVSAPSSPSAPPLSDIDSDGYIDTRALSQPSSSDVTNDRYIDANGPANTNRYIETNSRFVNTNRYIDANSRANANRYIDRRDGPVESYKRYIDKRDLQEVSAPSSPSPPPLSDIDSAGYIDTRALSPPPSSDATNNRYIDTNSRANTNRYIDGPADSDKRYIDKRDLQESSSSPSPPDIDSDGYIDTREDRASREVAVDWRRVALDAMDDANATGSCPSPPRQLELPLPLLQRFLSARYAEQVEAVSTYVQLVRTFLALGRSDAPDEDVFASVLRTVLERHPSVDGCALFLTYGQQGQDPASSFMLYAYRNGTVVRNLTLKMATEENATTAAADDSAVDSGYRLLTNIANAYKKRLSEAGKAPRTMVNGTSAAEERVGSWHLPWMGCDRKTWSATYSLPIFDDAHWRGVLMVNIDLSVLDVDQCAPSSHLFGGTHLCHRDTMQCIHRQGRGFRRGSYRCSCLAGFFYPNSTSLPDALDGSFLERTSGRPEEDFRCLPCHSGCEACSDPSPCFVDYDLWWRGVPLGLQSFCMTISVVLAISVFQLRKCKVIATGMWTVLEMILVGALLLYSTVVIRYFEPTTVSCLLEPWFREMGFAICYGTIILKMYRILVEFRTRKAHRWVIRDKDLLKYLAGISLVVIGYMSAWTAINVDHMRDGDSVVDTGHVGVEVKGQPRVNEEEQEERQLAYDVCKSRWWDYVTEGGELTFLIFGIYISYHIRNASSPYNEKRHLCLAIYTETLVSLSLYVLRHHVWLTFHPDYIFLMYFARCQLTVSITLFLIFGPKLWYHYRPPNDGSEGEHGRGVEGQDRTAPEGIKLQDGITSNGEVDIGEVNLADMDPEDIRAELRRVYTQLQVLRNKTMRKDNPHISKRRGGRKATHRRFSLQAFHRHRHHHDQEHETDISKTPEESTGSADAGASPAAATAAEPGSEAMSGSRRQL